MPAADQPQTRSFDAEPLRQRGLGRVSWLSVLMFLYGAGWSISFDLGVRLYAAELIVMLGLLTIRWTRNLAGYKALWDILTAYGLWIFAICVSDIVNGTQLLDVARNVSTPILGGASLVLLLAVVSREPYAVFAFLIGTVIFKAAFGDALYGDTFADVDLEWANIQADTNIFKVRIDPFLTPAIILIGCYLSRSGLFRAGLFLLVAGAAYFALDSRSTALALTATALILLAVGSGYRPRGSHVVIAAVVAFAFLYGVYFLYVEYTLTYNALGHNGRQLMRLENPYNPFALLLQARSEWLVWPIAFAEKPVFGWGSWALDETGRFDALRYYMMEQDRPGRSLNNLEHGYIPVHSLVGAALVWSGLLGLAAMALLIKAILTLILYLPAIRKSLLPAAAFFGCMVLWHFFFSPPQHVRISFPFALSLLIAATAHAGPFARWRAQRGFTGPTAWP